MFRWLTLSHRMVHLSVSASSIRRHIPFLAHFSELAIGAGIFIFAPAVLATPPQINLTSPLEGATVSGIVTLSADVTNAEPITRVEFYIDGGLRGTDVADPYTINWDATFASAGSHNVQAIAYDNVGGISATPLRYVTIADTIPPSVPSNIQSPWQTVTSVRLTWDPSYDQVGTTGYRVYRNGVLVASPSGTSYTDSGLNPNVSYSYYLTAFDAANNVSSASTTVPFSTLPDTTAPSVPTNIQATDRQLFSIDLSWDASTDNHMVSGYRVYRDGVLIASPTGTTYSDTGLNYNTEYDYSVAAVDPTGNVSLLGDFTVSTLPDTTAPSVPTNIQATDRQLFSIDLSWDASTDDVATTGYRVYRDGVLIASPTGTTYSDTGLSYNTSYDYQIRSADASGNISAYSTTLNESTLPDVTAPSIPLNLVSSAQTVKTISLSWDASTDDVATTGYRVYRDGVLIASPASNTYVDANLDPDTPYDYYIRAFDESGNVSSASTTVPFSTLPDTTAPSVPTNIQATDRQLFSIDLSWDASIDDVATTGYRVYRDGVLIASPTGTTYSDTGLSYNTSYSYTIEALDAIPNISAVGSFTVSTLPDTTPPNVVFNNPANGVTLTGSLTISASATDQFGVSVTRLFIDNLLVASANSDSVTYAWDTNTASNTGHTIMAQSTDINGNTTNQTINVTVYNKRLSDFNNDNKVNIFDLSTILSRWGKPGTGDFNGNGKVDIYDLSFFLHDYGRL